MTTRLLTILFLAFTIWGSSASRPRTDMQIPGLPCLGIGTWGNDWPLCGRVRITPTSRGSLQQRLAQELKMTIRLDGTGELSFYDCQTQQRIPEPVPFRYNILDGRLNLNWQGSVDNVRQALLAFNFKQAFRVNCRQDTMFVDSLMQNTMYRGATYLVRRN